MLGRSRPGRQVHAVRQADHRRRRPLALGDGRPRGARQERRPGVHRADGPPEPTGSSSTTTRPTASRRSRRSRAGTTCRPVPEDEGGRHRAGHRPDDLARPPAARRQPGPRSRAAMGRVIDTMGDRFSANLLEHLGPSSDHVTASPLLLARNPPGTRVKACPSPRRRTRSPCACTRVPDHGVVGHGGDRDRRGGRGRHRDRRRRVRARAARRRRHLLGRATPTTPRGSRPRSTRSRASRSTRSATGPSCCTSAARSRSTRRCRSGTATTCRWPTRRASAG